MKVSIIIPVYNAANTLEFALKSLAAQTLDDIEYIAVNDDSTDESSSILHEWARQDRRLRVIDLRENAGTLVARKRGIEAATGEYLLFLDPDDDLMPDAAEYLSRLADDGNFQIVEFGLTESCKFPDGRVRRCYGYLEPRDRTVRGEFSVFEDFFMKYNQRGNLCFKLVRRDLCLKALQEVEDEYCIVGEDLWFSTVLSYFAENYRSIPRPFYHYRVEYGVTGGGRTVSPAGFMRSASLMTALAEIGAFLARKKLLADPAWRAAWHRRKAGQIRRLVAMLCTQVLPEERENTARRLLKCYGEDRELAAQLAAAARHSFVLHRSPPRLLLDFLLPPYSRRRYWVKKFVRMVRRKGF